MLIKQPTFKDIRVDLLFENFDRRIELAKYITKGLQDIESTMKDDQFKSAAPGQEVTGFEKVSLENNAVWKQAVRLALARSVVSAKAIIDHDRSLTS